MDQCTEAGCSLPRINRFYDGKAYCQHHYKQHFLGDFQSAYAEWVDGTEPSEKFRSLAGRMAEERWHGEGDITKARVRDRGFNFKKTPNGFTFRIKPGLNAFNQGDVSNPVNQTWEVNIIAETIAKC